MSVGTLNHHDFAFVSSEQILEFSCIILKHECLRLPFGLAVGRVVVSIVNVAKDNELLSRFRGFKSRFEPCKFFISSLLVELLVLRHKLKRAESNEGVPMRLKLVVASLHKGLFDRGQLWVLCILRHHTKESVECELVEILLCLCCRWVSIVNLIIIVPKRREHISLVSKVRPDISIKQMLVDLLQH